MNCEETRNHFYKYLDDTLSTPQTQEIRSHLEACTTCATWFDRNRSTDRIILSRLRKPRVPDHLSERISAVIQEETTRLTRLKSFKTTPRVFWLPWIGFIAVVVLLSLFVLGKTSDPEGPDLRVKEIVPLFIECHNSEHDYARVRNLLDSDRHANLAKKGGRLLGELQISLIFRTDQIPCHYAEYEISGERISYFSLSTETLDWGTMENLFVNDLHIRQMVHDNYLLYGWIHPDSTRFLLISSKCKDPKGLLQAFLGDHKDSKNR
ncbi:MAG: zf-HC2 domain-containing protein [Planctomycetota bacterium]|jgi:hypothetical protein|nr:zf-HC2 domain-containing protein [Planctomycetota bacterium]